MLVFGQEGAVDRILVAHRGGDWLAGGGIPQTQGVIAETRRGCGPRLWSCRGQL